MIGVFGFKVIETIASAIGSTDGVNLLDVDPGLSTNRTVYTFVGAPDAVIEGALNGARAAMTLIDMRRHRGALVDAKHTHVHLVYTVHTTHNIYDRGLCMNASNIYSSGIPLILLRVYEVSFPHMFV